LIISYVQLVLLSPVYLRLYNDYL